MAKSVYVIHTQRKGDHWILTPEPGGNAQKAQRAINWQGIGQGDEREWSACTFNAKEDAFEDAHGNLYKVNRGPYTEAAHERHMAAIRADAAQ